MNQKPAIAIKSCHKYGERRTAQLKTWLRKCDIEFFFILGQPLPNLDALGFHQDTLHCDVSDSFKDIAPKVACACLYALEQNITNLLVCDDDSYIVFDRMMKSGYEKFDYVGHMRTDDIDYNRGVPYAQGHAYWLSAYSMERVAKNRGLMRPGIIDDGAVGQALDGLVPLTHDRRYRPGPVPTLPFPDSDFVSLHKCDPATIQNVHLGLYGPSQV